MLENSVKIHSQLLPAPHSMEKIFLYILGISPRKLRHCLYKALKLFAVITTFTISGSIYNIVLLKISEGKIGEERPNAD